MDQYYACYLQNFHEHGYYNNDTKKMHVTTNLLNHNGYTT